MLATTHSPGLSPATPSAAYKSPRFRQRAQSAHSNKSVSASPIVKPHLAHVYSVPSNTSSCTTFHHNSQTQCSPKDQRSNSSVHSYRTVSRSTQTSPSHLEPISTSHTALPKPQMVDAQTQYSPPSVLPSDSSSRTPTTATQIADLQIVEQESESSQSDNSEAAIVEAATRHSPSVSDPNEMSAAQTGTIATSASTTSLSTDRPEIAKREPLQRKPSQSYKRNHSTAEEVANPSTISSDHDASIPPTTSKEERRKSSTPSSAKKMRPENEPARILPLDYSLCAPRDLVLLISSMLMDLIRYNDTIPLRDGHLTRFHSRAPPGISVTDYLQRLTTHATLPPPILLSMVYYIDKLCALYPAFTISSLTVHRFLITAATVASKGLSDSFWTNKTYARVGGVSLRELALLEQEFLVRVQWRIVPQPEVLVDYYKSLVNRTAGYELESEQAAAGRAAHQHETGLARDAG